MRIQCSCIAKDCPWTVWMLMYEHTCIPFGFEKGNRRFSSDWLAKEYVETCRFVSCLRMLAFTQMVERNFNYKPTLSMCLRARNKALNAIMGDYKVQFSLLRDYGYEVLKQNRGSTVKFTTYSKKNQLSSQPPQMLRVKMS